MMIHNHSWSLSRNIIQARYLPLVQKVTVAEHHTGNECSQLWDQQIMRVGYDSGTVNSRLIEFLWFLPCQCQYYQEVLVDDKHEEEEEYLTRPEAEEHNGFLSILNFAF